MGVRISIATKDEQPEVPTMLFFSFVTAHYMPTVLLERIKEKWGRRHQYLFLYLIIPYSNSYRRMCWWRDHIIESVEETVEFLSICCSAKNIAHDCKHAQRSKLLLAYCGSFCDG